MKINFIDLARQQDRIRPELDKRIADVLAHGKYIMGPEINELESELVNYTGAKHCVSCASGTDALLMALMAMDVGPGDAIFTTPFTFISTAEVVALLGATPVFVDIEPETFNIDVNKLREAIASFDSAGTGLTPRGIIPVDLFGQPADYDGINAIARQNNLFVLEDAAQSFGSEYKGKKACNLAEIAATSFFPAKPLGGYGDGGAVFCQSDEVAAKLKSVRIHGKGDNKYDNVRIGINGRLDTLQAAILLAKLSVFDEEIALKNRVANTYARSLENSVMVPKVLSDRTSVWAQYSVRSASREDVLTRLREQGVPSAIYYPKPLHLQDAFKDLGYKAGDFPVCEEISHEIFSLPMHAYLTDEELQFIAAAF